MCQIVRLVRRADVPATTPAQPAPVVANEDPSAQPLSPSTSVIVLPLPHNFIALDTEYQARRLREVIEQRAFSSSPPPVGPVREAGLLSSRAAPPPAIDLDAIATEDEPTVLYDSSSNSDTDEYPTNYGPITPTPVLARASPPRQRKIKFHRSSFTPSTPSSFKLMRDSAHEQLRKAAHVPRSTPVVLPDTGSVGTRSRVRKIASEDIGAALVLALRFNK